MQQSENINELAAALAKCQGEMTPAIKDSTNPHFKSKFATLYSIWQACREPLSKNGLSVVQTMGSENDRLYLTTKLMHASGQWISSVTQVISARQDAQGIGSALSYFKRYSLSALLGICTADEDDDAEAAMPKERNNIAKEKPKENLSPISADKLSKLMELADKCDPDYIAKVYSYLETQNVNGFDRIPEALYQRVLTGMQKNIELREKDA